ncbi:MAG TPA: tetratricopeptide repeat protein [Polyangia bacterium]|nr:tetratricopeptide repeat protein [Polyangia bacterium]
MPPTTTPREPDGSAGIEELLKKGRGQGGPAADALRKAARLTRERGDALQALELYLQASERAAAGPTEPKLASAIELELGALYEVDLGRLDRAMERYQRAFKLDKTSTPAIDSGRRIYRALGDWAQVVRLYEVELEVGVSRERKAEILLALGKLLAERMGDPAKAADRLEDALSERPDDEAARELLASLYVSPDFPEAPDDETQTARLERAAQLFIELADLRHRRKDREGEVAFLRRALGADPFHVDAATRLEAAYAEAGRTDELKRLYRLDAAVPNRALKQAQLAVASGELDEAREAALAAHAEGDDATDVIHQIEAQLEAAKDHAGLADFRQRLIEASLVEGPDRIPHLLDLATLHQRTGPKGAAAAENALKEVLTIDPAHDEAFKRLADLLAARRAYDELVAYAEAALEQAPFDEQPRRLAELAELYEKKAGDVAAAADAWLRSEAIQQTARGAHELKRLQQKQERWVSLTAALERELAGADSAATRADTLKRLAQVHRERHELAKAAELLDEAIELRPDDPALYRALADLHDHQGHVEEVAKTIRRQLKIAKEKVERLNLLRRVALLYDERLDDVDGVVWACEEILQALPGDRDALKRLEHAYEQSGDDGEEPLIGILEKHAQASATPAERAPIYHRLAALYEKRGDLPQAADRLERALKLDKNDAKAQDAVARVYEAMGRWADAALAYERVLARAPAGPDGAEPWKKFARIIDGKLGDPARAAKAWREVLERRPTDREALEAVAKLARSRGDAQLLDEVLARRQQHAGPDEAAALALERAALADERLNDRPRAIQLLRQILEELSPRDVEAHARLRKLERLAGNVDGSLRVAERELFLTPDPKHKLAVALEIARAWRDEAHDPKRAVSAFERVLDFDPTHWEGLSALAALYSSAGEWDRMVEIDERRLQLADARRDSAESLALLFELALVCEEHLHDPPRAFEYLKRAHAIDKSDGTIGELRRVAEAHALWEDMCAVYANQPGLEARLQVAQIADERMNDPKRAFAVVRGALDLDADGTRLLGELERLSVRAADPAGLLEVYETLIRRKPDGGERVELLQRRAQVREQRMKDASGALDEILRAFQIDPDDGALLGEIRRLAEATGRWEDALAIEGFRFHRAPAAEKLAIAMEAAALVEEKVKDPLRAFRAYLRAMQLQPDDERIRDHLWRLARAIGEVEAVKAQSASAKKPYDPMHPPKQETTLEIQLDDAIVEDPPIAVKSGKPPRRDSTVELSIEDLVPHKRDSTIDLSLSDVASVMRPPPLPGTRPSRAAAGPPPLPSQHFAGKHSAWEELAMVQLTLPAPDEATRFRHLLKVSDMWERGAGDLDRAFEALATAFRIDAANAEARAALERLAERTGAWDKLVAVLDEAVEATGSPEQAVWLLLDSADVRLNRQQQSSDAEERLHRALGMRPDFEPALEKLETMYRQNRRLPELASLLERRMGGLMERMPPGEPRRLRAIELAHVYQDLGNTYEAISAWRRVADEAPDYAQSFAELARLYESVGQWSKVIEALTRELDLADAGGPAGQARARELRRRVGEIFEKELELPDRAIEAYAALHDADPNDAGADEALERLYEKLGRHRELEALYARRTARATADPEGRAKLLEKRASLLAERIGDFEAAAQVLRQLKRLRPDDEKIPVRLADALAKAGKRDEQLEVLREQATAAGRRGVPVVERVRLLVEVARLEADSGDTQGAQRTLERALDLHADDPQALAELARLREGGSDWDGYAAAREREAEVAPSVEQAVRALVDAARVHDEKRQDAQSAKRDLERALEKDALSLQALSALGAIERRLGHDNAADALARRELALEGDRAPAAARRAELEAAIGFSHLRREDLDSAAHQFREALGQVPGFPQAIHGLADVAARSGNWDEVEALVRDAAVRDGVPPEVAAQLHRRLADAAEAQGRDDEAYAALLEADRLLPNDLRTRLRLGENRFKANRFREAAQYLTPLAEHPETASLAGLAVEAGEALYHAALAELKLRRPERVLPLVEAAVRIHPRHVAALGLLAERAIEAGDLPRAVDLLERQAGATEELVERAKRHERLGEVILSELKDVPRACAAFERALEAAGDGASDALLERTLRLERESGQLERAAQTAARLLERDAPPDERARRLRETASLDAALGRTDAAKARLRTALEIQPLDHEALAGLSAMLVTEGKDDEAAQLLTRALGLLPPPDAAGAAARATLWMRLGECRERLRDGGGAVKAFEKALEADPSRRGLREALLARYGDDAAHDDVVRAHRRVLLADDPLHVPSLRAMARIDQRTGARDGGRRYLELLAVAGAISDDERRALSDSSPRETGRADDGPVGSLDEDDHAALAHPDALALAPVFAALWEGTGGDKAPDLAHFSVGAGDRVSPVGDSDLARAYSRCSLALGNRKTGLYLKNDPAHTTVELVAHPPTAIVVGPSLTAGRSLADVRFLLGRALEIARPEYVLAAALDREQFTRLLAAILRAFHPRHARRRLENDAGGRDDEAARWKRALPYKVAKRLAELFTEHADTEFSSARWRRAVQHTGNRAGLVACGDVVAAARVLTTEGDGEALRELARFAVSDDYAALRTKLAPK